MTFQQFADSVFAKTQESMETQDMLYLLNSSISNINIQLGTQFPDIKQANEEYTAIPKPWDEIIVLYTCYQIGLSAPLDNFIVVDFKNRFDKLITSFVDGYDIPEQYKGSKFRVGKVQALDWTKTQHGKNVKYKDTTFDPPYVGFRRR